MSVTGVLLAYERQLIRFFDRDLHPAPPSPGAAPMPMSGLLAGFDGPTSVAIHSDPTTPAEVSFGRDRVLLVDRCSRKTLA